MAGFAATAQTIAPAFDLSERHSPEVPPKRATASTAGLEIFTYAILAGRP